MMQILGINVAFKKLINPDFTVVSGKTMTTMQIKKCYKQAIQLPQTNISLLNCKKNYKLLKVIIFCFCLS